MSRTIKPGSENPPWGAVAFSPESAASLGILRVCGRLLRVFRDRSLFPFFTASPSGISIPPPWSAARRFPRPRNDGTPRVNSP